VSHVCIKLQLHVQPATTCTSGDTTTKSCTMKCSSLISAHLLLCEGLTLVPATCTLYLALKSSSRCSANFRSYEVEAKKVIILNGAHLNVVQIAAENQIFLLYCAT